MIVVVKLTTLWLGLVSDPAQARSFPYLSAASSQPKVQATARLYAGGNTRMVRRRGRQSGQQFTLLGCDAAQRQLIEFDWLGQLLAVRDDRGRKYFGFYVDPQITEHAYNGDCDISITVTEVTRSEAV